MDFSKTKGPEKGQKRQPSARKRACTYAFVSIDISDLKNYRVFQGNRFADFSYREDWSDSV